MQKVTKLTLLVLMLSSIMITYSCKKDFKAPETAINPENCLDCLEDRKHLFVRSSNDLNDRDGDETEIGNRKIELGAKRANPFSVAAMTQAFNTLWPQHQVAALPASHLYVRFKPASLEEYKLLEPFNLPLRTFPLDYEILKEGDWYDDPTIPNDQIPWLYSVVKPDFQFPAIQYEILEPLFLASMKSELTRRSFSIVEYNTGVSYRDACEPECPNWPECEDLPSIGCGDIGSPNNGGGGGGDFPPSEFPLHCDPDDPEYIGVECFEVEIPQSTPTFNSCGCPAYGTRNPAGCVKVVDTQLPANGTLGGAPVHLAGVDDVEIEWWNGWFGFWSTETDSKGCWRIDHKDYGNGYMLIKFKNNRGTIRGLRGDNFWEYAFAVQDWIGKISGPTFNDITVVYTPSGANDSAAKLFWYAATCNNALADYHSFAASDGIATPPNGLDILLSNETGAAAAPMFNKSGMNWNIYFGIQPLLGAIFGIAVISPLGPALQLLAAVAAIWAPDVVYLYGSETMRSDAVKETFYHEFGHAAHYKALNNKDYWKEEVLYTVGNYITNNNSPYGTRGTPGFERAAIIESWGYHIGPAYADRQYGLFHSRTTNPDHRERRRWKYFEESFVPDTPGDGSDNFIPKGLCLDLIDNNASNPPNVIEGLSADPISGFTNSNYFNAISFGAPTQFSTVESNLNSALPPGVTPVALRSIFAAYGY
jgi:hypothetical protein